MCVMKMKMIKYNNVMKYININININVIIIIM